MYVKHVLLDLYVYHALNVYVNMRFKNACFTHNAHFPVYFYEKKDDFNVHI